MVEHPSWVKLFKKMRPSYKLPTRQAIATKYLDEEYTCIQNEISSSIQDAQNLSLQCDGWSNIRNESIIDFVISKPEPVFVKSINTEDNKHTAKYLCDEIVKVIEEYDPKKFFALIGDNAPNIQKAFSLTKEQYPHIQTAGCLAHTLHLLCGDILKCNSINKFMTTVTEITKKIRGVQILAAMLADINKQRKCNVSLKLPANTRWGSSLACLESLFKNKASLQQLSVKEEASTVLPSKMKQTLLDDNVFWIQIEKLIALLCPIVKWINLLQTDKCVIHRVHGGIVEIENALTLSLPQSPITKKEEEQIMMAFLKRKKNIIKALHYAAALLNPSNQGFNLSHDEQIDGMEFIHSAALDMGLDSTAVMEDLANYRAKHGMFAKSFLWSCANTTSPTTWWRGLCGSSLLAKIAIQILEAPVTSAATERTFKTFSFIHNKRRNRLTTKRAFKLTYIAHNWKLKNDQNKTEAMNREVATCNASSSQSHTASSSNTNAIASTSQGLQYRFHDNEHEDNESVDSDSEDED